MKTTAPGGALARAMIAALALTAAISSAAALRDPTNERTSQYCAPIEGAADANAHRFYCRDGRSFEQHGSTPAAANWI
jgi:hypothetical protein